MKKKERTMLRKKKTSLLIGLAAVLALATAVLSGCAPSPVSYAPPSLPGTTTGGMMGGGTTGMTTAPGGPATGTATMHVTMNPASVSNGRSIYLYGTSDSGSPVTYTDGSNTMMQGRLACATCHGADGHGGTFYVMMRSYHAPDITWATLSGPDPDMQHPPYTADTLQRAITEGLDPGGSPLDYPMPHWQMSQSDLNDLIAYLKTLK